MSLDTIYADDIEAGLKRWAANPGPDPGQDFHTVSFLSAGLKAIPAAALEVGGTVSDILSGAATADAASSYSAGGMFSTPSAKEQQDQEAARQRMLQGNAFDVTGGNAARRKAEEFSPDPLTAHAADQVLGGLVRFGAKAGLAVGTMGPFGALLLGGEEANTATQRLREQGVDTGTATKVGAVEGAFSAAGAVLPMGAAGKTLAAIVAKSAGLVAAGGPGAYVAQEALSRRILESAGQNDQASLHNPFDPLGLVVSTVVPGVFGGLHVAGQRSALAKVVEHIESGGQRYGKDGELLTSPKGAQGEMQVMPGTMTDPGFGVRPADLSGTKDQQAAEIARVGNDYLAAMQQRYPDDPAKALAAYNAGPGKLDKVIAAHGDDWLKNMPRETQEYVHKARALTDRAVAEHAAQDPAAVDAARVATTNDAMVRSLPDTPDAVAQVQRAADIVGESGGRAAEQAVPEPIDFDGQINELRQQIQGQSREISRLQAEGNLPEGARTIANKAGDLFYDTRGAGERFHGSSNEVAGLSDDYALTGDNRNIYGQGFYTTDAADISNGYMKKGRGNSPTLYKVREKNSPKLFDMEAPLTPEMKAKAEEILGPLYRDTDVNGKDIHSLRELYDEARGESQGEGYSRDEVQEVFDSFRHYLEQQGYDGFSHVGGAKTGNRAHAVNIYWTPEKHVDIEKADIGSYRAPQRNDAAIAQAVDQTNALTRRLLELKAQKEAQEQQRSAVGDNALPPHDSVTLAGDEPAPRGEELGKNQRAAAEAKESPASAAKPKDPEALARDLELLQKRHSTLQTLLECLEGA